VLAKYADGKRGPAEPEPEEEAGLPEHEIKALIALLLPPGASFEERAALGEQMGWPPEIDVKPPTLDGSLLPHVDDKMRPPCTGGPESGPGEAVLFSCS
jgi:hypothetical protein